MFHKFNIKFLKNYKCYFSTTTLISSPLNGIRILDMTRILAGPLASQILGDMGAEIIKIEQPNEGDLTRKWGPPFHAASGESGYFLTLNRNKKSIAINCKSEKGINIVKELIKKSDVLLENFVPNKMVEMGLGYDVVNKINPRIIYASLSGFGNTGPNALRPGFDIIVAGMYGMMSVTGEENSLIPGKPGVAMTDVCAGLFLHGAVLAALFERSKSNLGQKIETSLMEGQLATLVNTASSYLITNEDDVSPRLGTKHKSIVPYQSFLCKDGKSIIVGIGTDKQFQHFCKALNIIDISIDKRFTTNKLRVENRNILIPYLEKIFMNNDRNYYENEFAQYSFPYGPVRTIKESFECPQAQAREMLIEIEHPTIGKLKSVGYPVKYSRTPCTIRLPPPLLGQHTIEILKDLVDYSTDEINEFITEGIIQ